MGTFTGRQYRGAARDMKERRRNEDETRNGETLPANRRQARLQAAKDPK